MAFSQSFGFSDSTFMKLENDLKGPQAEKLRNNNNNQLTSGLEIIQESPPKFKSRPQRLYTQSTVNRSNVSQRQQFRRSKSDSKLGRITGAATKTNGSCEQYLQFFKDDFSLTRNQEQTKGKQADTSQMRVSQILTNLDADDEVFASNSQNVSTTSVFEAQICTEDVFGTDTETETVERTNHSPIELANLDESSFLLPVRDAEASQQLQKDLMRSRCEMAKQSVAHCQRFTQNLSSMSPNQLYLSPSSPAFTRDSTATRDSTTTSDSTITKDSLPATRDSPAQNPIDLKALKLISAWNLPHSVLGEYKKKGVVQMFDWQVECLCKPKVLFEHSNLVYSAPTSAGKTLVSEILLLKTVLERGKKVLLILPFISVVREKMFYLQDLLTPAGYRVEGFFGGYTPPGGFESIHVAICTIEKANSIVNKLLEQGKLDEIGTVVVDEVHLISDAGRGYILELLLAKVLYMSRKHGLQIQIITMSATLANVQLLQQWLNAELYITDYRPVALQEMIKVGNKIYDNQLRFLRNISSSSEVPPLGNDADHVAQLCIETLLEGCSVVVFCPSKDWCENLAVQLATAMHALIKSDSKLAKRLRSQLNTESIEVVKQQLRDIPTGLDAIMSKAITYGCAFHHAGLTTEERDIVEASFKAGALKVIVATSTLSSGVNLPARRVLIRSPLFGGKQMSSLTYRQMIGRAGRTGKDTLGESILICTESNARIGRELVTAQLKPIRSCLDLDGSTHLKRALLEVISSGVASSKKDVDSFFNCTLLSVQKTLNPQVEKETEDEDKDEDEAHYITDALDFLVEYEFIRLQTDEETDTEHYVATRLGAACLASSMPPTDGLILFAELQKSRRCFVLESELHAVYLVTPYSVCYQLQDVDWLLYLDMWEKLNPAMKKVGELIGVKEAFLVRAMRGQTKLDYKLMQIHKRFYTALALQELVNETPINVVAHKFKCQRGMLQSLQQMASTFAGIVTAFCNSLQWSTLALVVSQFKDRLYFGIHRDLIDLMRLPDLTHKRARLLHDAGITSLVELAGANLLALEQLLFDSLSFDSAKQQEHEDAIEAAKRNSARNFFITGKAGMTVADAAKLLIQEARLFVQHEIGVRNIQWTQVAASSKAISDDNSKVIELHMSLEEQEQAKQRAPASSKTTESCSNLKVEELHMSVEEDSAKQQPPAAVMNSEVKGKTLEIFKAKQMSPAALLRSERKLKTLDSSKVTSDNIRKVNELHLSLEKVQNQAKQQPPAALMSSELKRKTPDRAERLSKVRKIEQASPATRQSIKPDEPVIKNSITQKSNPPASPKVLTERNPISSSTNVPIVQVEEKPSTSAASRNELLRKQIEDRRHAALMKINQRRAAMENMRQGLPGNAPAEILPGCTPDRNIVRQFQTETSSIKENLNAKELRTQTPHDKSRNNTPTQLPRRSPRNHQSTGSVLVPNKSTVFEQDLFAGEDDSFMLNTGLTAALTAAESKSHAEADEIPSSQPKESPDRCTVLTPHASRLMRSCQLRSKRRQSPKPEPQPEPESASSGGSSIELSNLSMENSLIKQPLQLNASHILSCSKTDENASSFSSIDVIDICGNKDLFQLAFGELQRATRCGFSVGLQAQAGRRKPLIGANLLINQVAAAAQREAAAGTQINFQVDDSSFVAGVAFCLADNVIYWLNMQSEEGQQQQDHLISSSMKVEQLCRLMGRQELTLLTHDGKEQLKTLRQVLPQLERMNVQLEDPKVGNWLLQPDKMLSFQNLCQQFAPECTALSNLCGSGRGYSSYGLDASSAIMAKVRASIEACVTVHILNGQIENLERIGTGQLLKFFRELEMPIQISLCHMESIGFPAKGHRLQTLFQQMLATMKKLEAKIYELHGSRFNLGSTQAVAKVLGLHRKANGRISTSRQILEKLDSPMSQLILNYRKLSMLLSKNMQPLLKCCQANRVHGQSITYTATGRISMSEPNLQNVAKDFEIQLGAEKINISCRSAFAPMDGKRCLLSADFCQLEMRILAHLSQDQALLKVMNSPQDLFTAIAAHWNKIPESEVSEQLRNGTKQICYGIVYGMGMRSLAESLKCTEQEAQMISEQFHLAYAGIKAYAMKVVKFARNNGYVETITGRRRYLDHINSGEPQIKNQAERQAINSTIQGSAADIAKSAILRMEKNIGRYREKLGLAENAVNLVLHLHDELIFEVPVDKAKKVAKVLSLTMENCVKLSVPLRVKLKIGRSWGDLQEVNV
ncbi:DNA polymerase theta [Drosophila grimshawi]|uniref:DNA polymerase theta n=1 Tax=Drosophila grimshawi TaxID=7222 RepID=B4JS84_DROGR|nr:DNA polymerase theta [Drosophila grimshawi]EDV94624.1 GH22128 [Drosophila grimshawi]